MQYNLKEDFLGLLEYVLVHMHTMCTIPYLQLDLSLKFTIRLGLQKTGHKHWVSFSFMTKALPVTWNIICSFSLFEHNEVYLLTPSSITCFYLLAKAFTGLLYNSHKYIYLIMLFWSLLILFAYALTVLYCGIIAADCSH